MLVAGDGLRRVKIRCFSGDVVELEYSPESRHPLILAVHGADMPSIFGVSVGAFLDLEGMVLLRSYLDDMIRDVEQRA